MRNGKKVVIEFNRMTYMNLSKIYDFNCWKIPFMAKPWLFYFKIENISKFSVTLEQEELITKHIQRWHENWKFCYKKLRVCNKTRIYRKCNRYNMWVGLLNWFSRCGAIAIQNANQPWTISWFGMQNCTVSTCCIVCIWQEHQIKFDFHI